jgi:hypothetical protein
VFAVGEHPLPLERKSVTQFPIRTNRPGSARGPYRLNLSRVLLPLTLAVLTAGSLLYADTPETPPAYTRTVTDQEALDHISGRMLDEADPVYCEKTRDICLVALCGSTTRENTRPACWDVCTVRQFDRCNAKREAR